MESKKLFVGNLARRIDQDDLLNVFGRYGKIIECAKFHESYGFVRYDRVEDASVALHATQGTSLKNRPMKVEFAQSDTLPEKPLSSPPRQISASGRKNCVNRILRFQTDNAHSKPRTRKSMEKSIQKIQISKYCVLLNTSCDLTTPPSSPSTTTSTTVSSSLPMSPASSLSCCSSNSFYQFTDWSPNDNNSLYPIWNFVMFPELALKPEELSSYILY
ncbi:unnamed protein product [Didymodactylos carnosus]|uniref:RRM domain-containing protein n=1 Tax=Didymodactylos carnosus TaxID=1234261 RepID=A0A8S2JKW7_9BILA|nr:unnamed protein product [Didymodactylos carnosus]CAF3816034.1 unnamed protein product [Didymodactylos carnosus]